jgi:hypothetical protein
MRSPSADRPNALPPLALIPSPVAGDVKLIPRRRVKPCFDLHLVKRNWPLTESARMVGTEAALDMDRVRS